MTGEVVEAPPANEQFTIQDRTVLTVDGAEGIAFWISDPEREENRRVMLDEIPALLEFLALSFKLVSQKKRIRLAALHLGGVTEEQLTLWLDELKFDSGPKQ